MRPLIASRTFGIELRLLAILGVEGRFVAPAHAEINGEVAPGFPVGLGIESVRPPARQPAGDGLRKGGRAHAAQEKRRKIVTGIGDEGGIGPAHRVRSGRERLRQRIVARADRLIAEFESVLSPDLRQVVQECEILADILLISPRLHSIVIGADVEAGEGFVADVGNAEFLRPALPIGFGYAGELAPVSFPDGPRLLSSG